MAVGLRRCSYITLFLLISTTALLTGTQEQIKANEMTSPAISNVAISDRVLPNDKVYQDLLLLTQKYGCSNNLASNSRVMTRQEFAASLNACLDKVNELISSGLASKVSKADLRTLQKLQEEFAAELAMSRGRLDALEARSARLESQQFSTTTRLSGTAVFKTTVPQTQNNIGIPATPLPNRPTPMPSTTTVNQPAYLTTKKPALAQEVEQPKVVIGDREFNTENYNPIDDNPFQRPTANPLSTFSIDVDTASYSNVRRFLTSGQLPPPDAVRTEEMINYFSYNYPEPEVNQPFSVTTEVGDAPWAPQHKLVLVGLQGKRLQSDVIPASNLVFLIDVSGSMNSEDKLPLVKKSLRLLTNELSPRDRVSIVVYAGNAGLVLPPTPGNQKEKILAAIDRLEAGGSTAGGQGIELAYKIAKQNFFKNGNNRVILATDGDFNVGASSDADLLRLIEEKRKDNIFLTVLGFGTGNYKDSRMELLADKGNGNYAYIDTLMEAKKVLVTDIRSTLFTIAKDVKIQVEFNPNKVQAYRLIGYENRLLKDQDFNDDKKDAGEIGSSHTVTALYEIIPVGVESNVKLPTTDPLRYQKPQNDATSSYSNGEWLYVKLRYKEPNSDTSQLISQSVTDNRYIRAQPSSENLQFASAVAAFSMVLRNSPYKGNANTSMVMRLAREAIGQDREGYRGEFIKLVEQYRTLVATSVKKD